MTSRPTTFDAAWADLEVPNARSLVLAYTSLVAGGLACGAVLTDATGTIVAEGRNRAYDPPGGTEILQRSPLAHAETNVLAAVSTDRDLSPCTLWSTQEPCSMCTAAATFTGVGAIRHLAPDPWALAVDRSRTSAAPAVLDPIDGTTVEGPGEDDRWVVSANVLFLLSIGRRAGLGHPTIARNNEIEPETTRVVFDLLGHPEPALARSVEAFLSDSWTSIRTASEEREARRRDRP